MCQGLAVGKGRGVAARRPSPGDTAGACIQTGSTPPGGAPGPLGVQPSASGPYWVLLRLKGLAAPGRHVTEPSWACFITCRRRQQRSPHGD